MAPDPEFMRLLSRLTLTTKLPLIIEDVKTHPSFRDHHIKTGDPTVRSCVGYPLLSEQGKCLGSLCMIQLALASDEGPLMKALEFLSQQIVTKIEDERNLRKLARENEKLAETVRFQSAVIQNVPSLIYIKDAADQMRYTLVNPSFEKTFGLAQEDLLGKNDFDFYPQKLAEKRTREDLEIFAQRKIIKVEKEELDTALGRRFFTIYKVPVFDEINRPQMLIYILRDISDEIQAKQNLEHERMKSIHSAKLASLGELSAGIAHEINNPLAIISGSLDQLEKFKDHPTKLLGKTASIKKSVDRIAKIVSGLKKFSRYNDEPTYTDVPLNQSIKEALDMVDTKAKFLAVEIRTSFHSITNIHGNDLEIEQVIINLMNNAMDAIKEQNERWIEVSTFAENGGLVLRVMDSGPGISPEVEKNLFQPFFTTKPIGEGTGLGLSISREILSRHQAVITLNRSLKNTCFDIWFPVPALSQKAS
jgi:PAS domain S-box-containing protein